MSPDHFYNFQDVWKKVVNLKQSNEKAKEKSPVLLSTDCSDNFVKAYKVLFELLYQHQMLVNNRMSSRNEEDFNEKLPNIFFPLFPKEVKMLSPYFTEKQHSMKSFVVKFIAEY